MTYKSFQLEAESVVRSDHDASVQLNDTYNLEMLLGTSSAGDDTIDVRRFRLLSAHASSAANGAQSRATYVDTSFSMSRGETIVLGGSVTDQTARVILVTALK